MDGAAILLVLLLGGCLLLGFCLARVRGLGREVEQLRAAVNAMTPATQISAAETITPEVLQQLLSGSK